MRLVDLGDLRARTISQRLGRSEMREEVAVSLEDIELLRGRRLVVAAVGPRAGRGVGVLDGEIQGAQGDAEVEVEEDELDGREEGSGEGDGEDGWVGSAGLGVPAEGVGPGDFHFVDLDAA